jgi:ERCC4-type nuclease
MSLDVVELPGATSRFEENLRQRTDTYQEARNFPFRRIKLSTSYGSKNGESIRKVFKNLARRHKTSSTSDST